ncbi:MAG: hypothetical protein IJA95_02700 [Bacteroidaceae bacterium]|nr:hypothetical protein [Bacteroides sp.]MBQ4588180.1 hypothetical protein [Bacteroidaceae bacterium]
MYNILWLDDDFIGPDYTNGEDIINARRESFLDDVRLAEKFELNIDSAKDIDEFKTKFAQNPGKYQAVILDIMDLNPDDATDESALSEAIDMVKMSKGVLIYVYSNNPDKPGHKDYIKRKLPIGHSISKAGNVEELLYSKIVNDLSVELHYFTGHEECLELLNKGYLNTQNQMKTILKNIKDDTYMPFNDIRQVLENMLETMVGSGIIPRTSVGNDKYSTFNKRMEYITKQCPEINHNGKKIVDWNNPCVSYSDCRHEIKWVLDFLGNISNRYSHYQNANPNFLLSGELLEEYSTTIRKITYESFFVAMKWYLGYMTNKF